MNYKNNWNGILIVDEIIIKRNDEIIYKEENIQNIFHASGQYFFLQILFKNLENPSMYYLGLDNRNSLTLNNTLNSLEGEPVGKGYARQGVSLSNFSISIGKNGNYKAAGPTVTFNATTDNWGPVKNIFLTNVSSGVDGYLISSARLLEEITVVPSDSITLKFAFAFSN
jgi:hypothetical protein